VCARARARACVRARVCARVKYICTLPPLEKSITVPKPT